MSLGLLPSTAATRVQSPRRPGLKPQTVRRRACEVNLGLFDPFDFVNGDLPASEASRARTAIAACQSCPFLADCKEDTVAALTGESSNHYPLHPPTEVVQAAILWDENSEPYVPPAVKACDDMLPMELFTTGPIYNSSWSPPSRATRLNEAAISAALSADALDRTVTAHYLKRIRVSEDPTRMVLTREEELEVIRRGIALGYTHYHLAGNLRTSWRRINRTRIKYNLDARAED